MICLSSSKTPQCTRTYTTVIHFDTLSNFRSLFWHNSKKQIIFIDSSGEKNATKIFVEGNQERDDAET